MRRSWLLVLAVGCGRLQFDARDDAMAGSNGDAPRADAVGDGVAATTCGTFGSRACDGFEQGAIDPMWTLDTSAGSITRDTTRAFRGSASVHVHIDQITVTTTNPRATLFGPAGLNATVTGMIYFRVWMYVASPLATNLFNQMINAANMSGQGMSLGTRNGVFANNNYTDVNYSESATPFPLDRWMCLQYEMPSNTTGTARMFVDGAELTDAALVKTTPQPPPTHVYLGLEWVGNPSSMPAADAWLDEIIVDTNPTTCAQ
ncbi:MAG TPA: hypothetical protein VMZ53_13770 [Kofleriaceae bacterium]|nr:hypothetical protein [Kofleriaceae bacterium]